MPSSCFMLSSFFMSSFFILSFFVFFDFLSFFISSFFIWSLFIWSCFMSSCFMLSCFMLSPDCANAARDTARKHMAINLQIVFLMRFFLAFSLNLRPTHLGRANEMRFQHLSYRPFQRQTLPDLNLCSTLATNLRV